MSATEDLYAELAEWNIELDYALATLVDAGQAVDKTPEGKAFRQAESALDRIVAAEKEARDQLKAAALSEYEANGEKRPHEQVGISISKKAVYLESEAIDWAKENRPAWITLPAIKKRPFEKYARAVAGADAPLDFVSFEESASVTIKLEAR